MDTNRGATRLTRRRKFFDTFGFLYLPGLLVDDIEWITSEFDAVWARRPDVHHDGSHRTMFPDAFLNASDVLARLIEHPVLSELCEDLLGPGYAFYGGDGNYYSGDTSWHSDVFNVQDGEEAKSAVRHLKIAFYLDSLTSDTGALRVIPGTHYTHDAFARAVHEKLSTSKEQLDVSPSEVPAATLATTPGDIVIFDHRIKHASFGGGPARRMFTMNFFAPCQTERQRELTATIFRMYGRRGMAHFFTENVTKDAPAARLRHLEPALQFEAARAEGYTEYLAGPRGPIDEKLLT